MAGWHHHRHRYRYSNVDAASIQLAVFDCTVRSFRILSGGLNILEKHHRKLDLAVFEVAL